MIDSITDAEKIERLWQKVEALRQENASLTTALNLAEQQAESSRLDAEYARMETQRLAEDVMRMSLELNDARVAASEAVKEYILAQEG
jgi:hypothetical protein